MKRYKNLSGNSGVLGYETGNAYIVVKFSGGDRTYTYSYEGAGMRHVEKMKQLAAAGKGLSTYISKYVKDKYD
ncbi:hypothetical protein [Filimonas effusa]|uniref:KTSC domain-containing protein n=1 Tax=Filimonas effusa TaxID=2508721 RepID=A0A4Q1DAX0_9BACT|nr:hypothetical protein [Filimonas effusa]RXK85713.1 hypothetical protein ESB13_02540 [Filimonas effusa]